MVKRKAEVEEAPSAPPNRRSTRNKPNADEVKAEVPKAQSKTPTKAPKAKAPPASVKKSDKQDSVKMEDSTSQIKAKDDNDGPQYWLMKAEPETRIERGQDISFSIDDLASKTSPEPWDGIRNYAARNNLRAMKKGDLAFFYHSSCKVPAIVGIMEIVAEHTPDLSAQDPKKPYYDPKDTDPSNPKWSLVHVEFRRKFKVPVTLHELKELAKTHTVLQGMDLLGKGRLSVGKVRGEEWEVVMGLVERGEKEAKEKEKEEEEEKE